MKRLIGVLLAATLSVSLVAPAWADDQEQRIGQQVYDQLNQKGEIVTQSPYYSILNPIARRISGVANSQYDAPFQFIIVREKQPNAFAVPGGKVYVTEPMFTFAKNKEELAGVLCHETSHTIHHDVINLARKQQGVDLAANVLSSLLGGGRVVNFILGAGDQLTGLRFSRGVERQADLKGAHTCAQAGYNPWGMV
ncbi:MAG: M48 family metallopeptidase, partial [Candidatus Eremiobacteraeota bacterium]|nr:M48 family metallopeptidase [Candidatus Eremiobacteraeota bacterium]